MSAPQPYAACCGAPVRTWHSQGNSHSRADVTLCRDCSNETCSKCSASWDVDGGYGEDGSEVRVFAVCQACAASEGGFTNADRP